MEGCNSIPYREFVLYLAGRGAAEHNPLNIIMTLREVETMKISVPRHKKSVFTTLTQYQRSREIPEVLTQEH
jgi:hypothetical protein